MTGRISFMGLSYLLATLVLAHQYFPVQAFALGRSSPASGRSLILRNRGGGSQDPSASKLASSLASSKSNNKEKEELEIFERFTQFLRQKQTDIIAQLEALEDETTSGSGAKFCNDAWGIFEDLEKTEYLPRVGAGGITRVIQGGNIIEKGACSLTVIQNGVLSPERARAIRARQPPEEDDDEDSNGNKTEDDDDDDDDDFVIGSGDFYSAAALSIVFHSRSPMVPTFRSDVRIFLVQDVSSKERNRPVMAWFGGGADLTPYYLFDEDVTFFHNMYKDVCETNKQDYAAMKKCCDDYFFLPARSEHRGTGGIFFDDMEADEDGIFEFVQDVGKICCAFCFSCVHQCLHCY